MLAPRRQPPNVICNAHQREDVLSGILEKHLSAVETHLLAIAQIPAGTGHPLHKGTPREAFIREFLQGHLSEKVSVGTGEVISEQSKPGEPRNQIDVVIFKPDFPKLDIGGGIKTFLIESVVATVEVKSTLTYDDVLDATKAAKRLKEELHSGSGAFMRSGWVPPGILSFVVAYDGPAKMATVQGWIVRAAEELDFDYPMLPTDHGQRCETKGAALDAVFVLGRGFVQYDNFPFSFVSEAARMADPSPRWVVADTRRGSLVMLFAMLTTAVAGAEVRSISPMGYFTGWSIENMETRP